MYAWIRRVTPDLFLAAVIALLITVAQNQLDGLESRRIIDGVRSVAHDGLTFDERIGVFRNSIRRSTLLHLPFLVAMGAVAVGFICRNRSWAWLTAILAVIPALLMGVSFFFDTPVPAIILVSVYIALAVSLATASVVVRNRFIAVEVRKPDEPFQI
jgi:hypothetical protein